MARRILGDCSIFRFVPTKEISSAELVGIAASSLLSRPIKRIGRHSFVSDHSHPHVFSLIHFTSDSSDLESLFAVRCPPSFIAALGEVHDMAGRIVVADKLSHPVRNQPFVLSCNHHWRISGFYFGKPVA
jgi:hypothetical protein